MMPDDIYRGIDDLPTQSFEFFIYFIPGSACNFIPRVLSEI